MLCPLLFSNYTVYHIFKMCVYCVMTTLTDSDPLMGDHLPLTNTSCPLMLTEKVASLLGQCHEKWLGSISQGGAAGHQHFEGSWDRDWVEPERGA